MRDGNISDTLEIVKSFPIFLDGLNVPLDLLVVEKLPCDLTIGLPTLKVLQARLDIGTQTVTLKHNN